MLKVEAESIEAIQTLMYAWLLLSALVFVALYAILQSNRLFNVCHNAHQWAKEAISSEHDIHQFHEDLLYTYERNKRVPLEAIVVMIINALMLLVIKSGETSMLLNVCAAITNAGLLITVYNSGRSISGITRFIGQVETEAALREMRRLEVDAEEDDTHIEIKGEKEDEQ